MISDQMCSSLTLVVAYRRPPEASLVTNLYRMSCLRRLELRLVNVSSSWFPVTTAPISPPAPPASAVDIVPLSNLTDLIFAGSGSYLHMLVTGLATPSLRHLDMSVIDDAPPIPSIPHLCKFISDAECQSIAIRLNISPMQWRIKSSAETCSESDRAQLFRIAIHALSPSRWRRLATFTLGHCPPWRKSSCMWHHPCQCPHYTRSNGVGFLTISGE